MKLRDWIIGALLAFSWGWWFWQHERWHELNTRSAALAAEAKVYTEMCRVLKRPNQ